MSQSVSSGIKIANERGIFKEINPLVLSEYCSKFDMLFNSLNCNSVSYI